MTIGEFRSAEVKHKGSETIWIGKHKTAVQYGHASLFINPNVYKALEAYQDKIRSMTKPSTKAFFLFTAQGKGCRRMQQGRVCTYFGAIEE